MAKPIRSSTIIKTSWSETLSYFSNGTRTQTYPANGTIDVSPMCDQVDPSHLTPSLAFVIKKQKGRLTATVPNMAPLAPTDGAATSAKLPPKTLLDSA